MTTDERITTGGCNLRSSIDLSSARNETTDGDIVRGNGKLLFSSCCSTKLVVTTEVPSLRLKLADSAFPVSTMPG